MEFPEGGSFVVYPKQSETRLVTQSSPIPEYVDDELTYFEEQIHKYRSGHVAETKMQKIRLTFGTYAQRQEGVQMQRIKIPGGFLTADQLALLGDAADRFGSSFIHFTTREDAQIYYVKLEQSPALLRFLAAGGLTTREACGNTVRNITACHRSGTSPTEAFDVWPYAEALFRYLVRNKYNQNMGRKIKITFEGCDEDHSALRIHDIGFWAVNQMVNGEERRGFRVYLGGGLGTTPQLAQLYKEFLPAEEIFNLTASIVRLFDRYGERKARMKARMKFLIQSMGWDAFVTALEEERERVGPIRLVDQSLNGCEPESLTAVSSLRLLDPRTSDPEFRSWVRDSVVEHKDPRFRGVHVRLKLGDITSERARQLAEVVRRFSASQLRIAIGQNIYLPWVREGKLPDLYTALKQIELGELGVGTVADVTTCPGADTCRLGIASAKGLGSAISESFNGPLAEYRELARPLKIKISGCPNGCAQHGIADIGFHAAALSHDAKTVPAHLLFLGGQTNPDSARFASLVGKFPAKNCVNVIETLLRLYKEEKLASEEFTSFVIRMGDSRLKEALEPWRAVASFEADPTFYKDYGHENAPFAVRPGIKGECAESIVVESVPEIEAARELLAQAEAFLYHKEYEHATRTAYEAAAAGARVPLYVRLLDPFTADEALWEFENLFVLSGQTHGTWQNLSSRFIELKGYGPDENTGRTILNEARNFVDYCASFLPSH
jgi:sulfite reductase beta subunit-like hemoprotein